jgi:hypothetical protein
MSHERWVYFDLWEFFIIHIFFTKYVSFDGKRKEKNQNIC